MLSASCVMFKYVRKKYETFPVHRHSDSTTNIPAESRLTSLQCNAYLIYRLGGQTLAQRFFWFFGFMGHGRRCISRLVSSLAPHLKCTDLEA